jgi:polyphosphate kinase 2 (PPK2 family)
MAVFDRSWYGRVLVERIEGFASRDEWIRAYDEINAFERTLADEGTILIKFWLHISPAEQLKRFKAREKDPLKTWKLTDDDWRNREKAGEYNQAVEDMVGQTSIEPHAVWHLIPAESKRYARVAVIETVISDIEAGMRRRGIEPPKPIGNHH